MPEYEWEETDYVITFNPGSWYRGYTDIAVRQDLWMNYQSKIMPEIQKLLDQGWEPITEVGPGGFSLRHFKAWDGKSAAIFTVFTAGIGLLAAPFWSESRVEPTEFRVKLRRRKTS